MRSLGHWMGGCEVLLVSDCASTVTEGTDLDLDDDWVLDETPWTVVDSIPPSLEMHRWRPFDGGFWVDDWPLSCDSVASYPTRGAANNAWVLLDGATGIIPCGDLGLTINVTANTFDEPYYWGGRVPTSVLLHVERLAGNPGAAGGFDGSISPTSGDGTEITVDRQAHDFYFHVEVFKRATAAGDLTYDLSMDISALTTGVADPGKLVLMKRESGTSPWVPYPTSLTGSVLSVTGLTGFSEFAVGSNSAYNTLPVSLSGLELN